MGKQMTYYMEREVFTQLAQIAVDLGCVILKQNGSKIISGDTSIIDSHCSKYYFYLPAAGEINDSRSAAITPTQAALSRQATPPALRISA